MAAGGTARARVPLPSRDEAAPTVRVAIASRLLDGKLSSGGAWRLYEGGRGVLVRAEGGDAWTIENDRLAVTVSDNDLTDVLTIYFFTDYGFPAPVARRAECLAAPGASEEPQRTVLCDVNTVCLEGEQQTNPHIFEIEVFDRTPADGGDPLFRSVAAPGLSTSWWWQVNCTEAPS